MNMKALKINSKAVAIALVAIFSVAVSAPVFANPGKDEAPAEMKYLGKYNNQPVFELSFNNEVETEFVVSITDENKNVLYRDVIKGGTVSKKFMLNTEEVGNTALKFEITGKKTNKTVVYEINRNSRIVEDVIVDKIK